MKKYLIFIGIVIILLIIAVPNCQLPLEEEGSGNVIIETPSKINPLMKSVWIDDPSFQEVDEGNLDQNRFRYDLIVEDAKTGKRIAIKHLYRNEKTVLTVPTGRSLNFYVGVYYATSSRSYYETYNVYLASDKITNVRIMPGETQHLEFVLDVNRGLKADAYFFKNLFGSRGIANIISGVDNSVSDTLPYFSADQLLTSGSPTSVLFGFTAGAVLNASSPPIAGTGRLFNVESDPVAANKYWYLHTSGIRKNDDLTTGWTGVSSPVYETGVSSYISKLKFAKSMYVNDGYEYYLYFFSYGEGYLCATYKDPDRTGPELYQWSNLTRIDFSYLKSLYPYEDFLLDVEQDSSPNEEYTFFASKIGLFYIYYRTLDKFTIEGQKQEAIGELNKVIRIRNPADPRKMVLIRKVRVIGNKVYLGTRQGVYYINKTSSAWQNFSGSIRQASTRYNYRLFPEDEIHKMKDFYDEPVISLDEYDIDGDSESDILVIATPKRVYFYNVNTRKEKMITVWDGLPFTPYQRFENAPELNKLDFMWHEVAPIKFVLFNDATDRFWIGTDYGLASIHQDYVL